MEYMTANGVSLEYEVVGDGEPVVLIHGVLIAESFRPLLSESALVERYRLIHYHRRGYLGSSHTSEPISIARQADDCRALLRNLAIGRIHVVGHSYGGAIALQLALDAPDLVHSLVLLEPAILAGSSAESYRTAIMRDGQRYASGDPSGAVDGFLRARFGDGYRDFLDRALPGAFAQAVADAGTTFRQELPVLPEWRFGETEAHRISQPALLVLGEESEALWSRFGETHRLLREWLPRTESLLLPAATHALHLQNPAGMVRAVVDFFERHPLSSQL